MKSFECRRWRPHWALHGACPEYQPGAHRGSKIAGRHSGAQIGRALISPSLLLQVIVQSLKAAFHRFLRCLPREGECCHHHGRLILNRGREQWEHNATAARRPVYRRSKNLPFFQQRKKRKGWQPRRGERSIFRARRRELFPNEPQEEMVQHF